MLFRQYFDDESSTYTYLLADLQSGKAVLIDPVAELSDFYLLQLQEHKLTLELVLDTHTHADHISANGRLRDATGCTTMLGRESQSLCIDRVFSDGQQLTVGDLTITAIHTPGHTDDSYSFHVNDQGRDMLFTGDTLLINGSGRTDFQNGDARQQFDSIFGKLFSYPDSTEVYPGHDYNGKYVSTLGQERKHNPRLQVSSASQYEDMMNKLELPSPKLMDVAIPANQSCGAVKT